MKHHNPYFNGASLAYKVPRWDAYNWQRFKEQSPQTQKILKQGADKLFAFPAFGKEVFHRLYSSSSTPLQITKPEHAWAARAHSALEELPDFTRLAARCRGDRLLSGVAATAFSEKVLAELPEPATPLEDPQPLREQVRGLIAMQQMASKSKHPDLPDINALIGELTERGKLAVKNARAYAATFEDSALRQQLRAACASAEAKMDQTREHLSAFSFGTEPGSRRHGGDLDQLMSLAQRIEGSQKLQQIAREAGRMRRIAAQKQRSKCNHTHNELNSIETGAELSRLLPAELAKLAEPSLFGLFARGYVERGLLQYQLAGKEPQGRGPIVVCLDSSGSMAGEREIWSKAVALAFLSIAVAQNRTCRLIQFTDFVERIDHFLPGQVDSDALLSSMEVFFDGGTDYEVPLYSALEAIRSERDLKQADVIFITDGECCVTQSFIETWQQARQEHEFTCYGVLLGLDDSPVLSLLADPILPILDLANDTSATARLFSL